MPNPVPAKYTVQLGPTFTPEVAGELAAWAEVLGHSTSEITRWCTETGLEQLRTDFRARLAAARGPGAELPGSVLAFHVKAAQERGNRQVQRRKDYDDRTRNTADKQAGVKRRRAPRKAA